MDTEKDPKTIALNLAALCQNNKISPRPTSAEDSARFEQAFSFAYGSVQESMRTGHPELTEVFEVKPEAEAEAKIPVLNNLYFCVLSFLDFE